MNPDIARPLLDAVRRPEDLRGLPAADLPRLAQQIRSFLIEAVTQTGGHLGSNLGVVELTIAVHRVFCSPRDTILFDTGHQAYVHKLLTGRLEDFDTLRQSGGLSGYPSPAESQHDVIENSHASTALSYADGLAKARKLSGDTGRGIAVMVGDGAMTGGMAWEALNNLGASPDAPVVIVLNDNGRSYLPTVGGFARHLAELRAGDASENLFEKLGVAYLGPVDGHDLPELERNLAWAREMGRPVVVHCVTQKGKGYPPAESDELDRLHAVGAAVPLAGNPEAPSPASWTSVFADEITRIGEERPDVVCVTAAMLQPTGLGSFAARFPDRVFDVGIAEQHAVTAAAGMALGGLHPVVAIYSTFLGRALDQLLMDVALHRLPVTIVADRAGVTGPDGPSHHGMWDSAFLPLVPGLQVAAPRDPDALRQLLREAVGITDGPTVVRYPKSSAGRAVPALRRLGRCDVLIEEPGANVLLVGVGPLAGACVDAAEDLKAAYGVAVSVIDPRWTAPLDPALLEMAASFPLVLSVEDGTTTGALGARLAQALATMGSATRAATFALPPRFLPHGSRDEILRAHGLDASGIAATVLKRLPREVLDLGEDLP
ncbi:MAG TPA: 1-deoxy-D-xylulose-5-phosphate synthase [Actinomycetota bacterium]|nr:1-deoxy-D-xylulose-5-phosphate synthase [Actinomycetota bacterium]